MESQLGACGTGETWNPWAGGCSFATDGATGQYLPESRCSKSVAALAGARPHETVAPSFTRVFNALCGGAGGNAGGSAADGVGCVDSAHMSKGDFKRDSMGDVCGHGYSHACMTRPGGVGCLRSAPKGWTVFSQGDVLKSKLPGGAAKGSIGEGTDGFDAVESAHMSKGDSKGDPPKSAFMASAREDGRLRPSVFDALWRDV